MMEKSKYEYDVFISHAVEDKMPIANELCQRLQEKNLNVWYSGAELNVGDRLIDTIFKGMEKSRFGVVIISPTYISKMWALAEFYMLLSKEKDGQKVILPVLYDITLPELGSRSPLMADIWAIPASQGLDVVTEKLYNEIQRQNSKHHKTPVMTRSKGYFWVAAVILLLSVLYFTLKPALSDTPQNEFITTTIQTHIKDTQQKADLIRQEFIQTKANPATSEAAKKFFVEFSSVKSYFRNEYILNTGTTSVRAKRNVEAAFGIDLDSLSPLNDYSLAAPEIYHVGTMSKVGEREESFIYYITQPLTYQVTKSQQAEGEYVVLVAYSNPIRLIYTRLIFPSAPNKNTKRQQVTITATLRVESYTFIKKDHVWVLKSIQ